MAISVRHLEPVNLGIPTHAPKLWRMEPAVEKDNSPRSLRSMLRLLRVSSDPIDGLAPLARIWSVD